MFQRRLSIKDLPLKEEKVLMRVDFNVPLDKSATIKDDSRIRASLPSIFYVLEKGGSVILMSHLGRPKEKNIKDSLSPIAKKLSELILKPVLFADDCIGTQAKHLAKSLKRGEVLLLENLRFYPAEEDPKIDPEFAKTLASLGTVYVDDAFGSAHRAHASITEVPKYFKKKAALGLNMEKEIHFLEEIVENPEKPFVALIGGAKISTKIGVLEALLKKIDLLLIGGGMAYTFMKAEGQEVGKSLFEEGDEKRALKILKSAEDRKIPVFLPIDHVVTNSLTEAKKVEVMEHIPIGYYGVDIGPKTISLFIKEIKKAKTLFWNGPLGIFETPSFSKGTFEIAKGVAECSCVSIVGGGDSVSAIKEIGVSDKITHISTGGGATLEYIEKGSLPGIEAIPLYDP